MIVQVLILGFIMNRFFAYCTQVESNNAASKLVQNCSSVAGDWKNNLGSKLHLEHTAGQKDLFGWIRIGNEKFPGINGSNKLAQVIGYRNPVNQGVFTASVLWPDGGVTVWIGQCYILPNGVEFIKTMWLVQTPTTYDEYWLATRIGEDTFRKQ